MCDMWIAKEKKDLVLLYVGSLWPISNRFIFDRKKIYIVIITLWLSSREVKVKGH